MNGREEVIYLCLPYPKEMNEISYKSLTITVAVRTHTKIKLECNLLFLGRVNQRQSFHADADLLLGLSVITELASVGSNE